MSAIAIITARGGSKRIPRKNVRPFLGRPIIAYSIQAALRSKLFDEVMVSTDDDEIADIAQAEGAKVPFRRSKRMSDDHATTAQVLDEVLRKYQTGGRTFEYACCLYPTAPFVNAERLREAFTMLAESGSDAVVPVSRFCFPIWRAFQMDGGRLSYVWPENATKRSQDLTPAYHDAGQFYFFRTAPFLETGKLVGPDTIGIEVDELEVQDIDTERDWQVAELKYRVLFSAHR